VINGKGNEGIKKRTEDIAAMKRLVKQNEEDYYFLCFLTEKPKGIGWKKQQKNVSVEKIGDTSMERRNNFSILNNDPIKFQLENIRKVIFNN